jgi:predicted kinase/DNA-directed RNA polymerase subunit RPC12/RpoP
MIREKIGMSEGVLHAFYCSKPWLVFRQQIIIDRGTVCQYCGKHIFISSDIKIHHTPAELTEDNYKDVNIALNPENVKLICARCHNKAHGRFCGGRKKERGIYLVTGPPLSGKSTYVKENMTAGDLVVDMDKLYQAISYQDLYNKPDNLKYNIFAVKNLLVDNIKKRYGNFNSAWVIGSYPLRSERDRMAKELGAEVIVLDCTQEECIRRLERVVDGRKENKSEWTKYIQQYFESFTN